MARFWRSQSMLVCATFLLFVSFPCPSDAALAAMSVDFGSQYMKIGLVKPGVPMEIVLNRESKRKTQNVIAVRNGERFFSDGAANMAVKFPPHAYSHLPDLLGKKANNPIVELYRRHYPWHHIVPDDNRGTVVFTSPDGDGVGWTPVELVAQLLREARRVTEKFADQPVKDAVITVPPFFNQAERRAMTQAVNLAGLNLLQLLNDNTAAGLQYGVFRMKQFNESAQTLLIYDMGAAKTTATLFEYQVVKDKHTNEKYPQMTTLGFGYDRTLGGLEMTLRLYDHLVKSFKSAIKTSVELNEKTPRALAKLWKEAERVKQVLSANVDHFAQVENVMEEKDFHLKITREEFEEMCADIFERVPLPVIDALKMAEMTIEQVDTIVLMGAATRTPKVKEELQKLVKEKVLNKYLNTDEAAALGAVFQAAHLSKGFKVKRFGVKEMTIFPIQVDFEREKTSENEQAKIIRRTLFGLKNPYPMKKMLTFSKHTKDFEFVVNYGDLKHLSHEQLSAFGELNISRVDLLGVETALEKNRPEPTPKSDVAAEVAPVVEYKGVKAHFKLDDSGILTLDSVESVFEKAPEKLPEAEEAESTFAALGKKISGLFGAGEAKPEEAPVTEDKVEEHQTPATDKESTTDSESSNDKSATKGKSQEETKKEESKKETTKEPEKEQTKTENEVPPQTEKETEKTKKDEKEKKKEKEKTETKEESKKNATNTTSDASKTEKKPPKPTIVKVPLKTESGHMDLLDMNEDMLKAARKRLDAFDEKEASKAKREAAQNSLESFVFETKDKLEQTEYQKLTTEEERTKALEQLKLVADWLEEEAGFDTETKEFEDRLKQLKDLTKDMFYRHKETQDLPKYYDALVQTLNHTVHFLGGIKNLTEDIQIFTATEIETLEKLINDTVQWMSEKQVEQKALKPSDMPALTTLGVAEKVHALDREMKYLLNKAKNAPPPKPKNATSSSAEDTTTTADKTNTTDTGDTIVTPDDVTKDESDVTTEKPIIEISTEADIAKAAEQARKSEEDATKGEEDATKSDETTESPTTSTANPEL